MVTSRLSRGAAPRCTGLERLFTAVHDDGLDCLAPVEGRRGEIARYPDLVNSCADLEQGLRRADLLVRPPGSVHCCAKLPLHDGCIDIEGLGRKGLKFSDPQQERNCTGLKPGI